MEVIRLQAKLNRKGKLSPKEQARLDFLKVGRDPKTGRKFPEELPASSRGGSSKSKNKPTAGQIADAGEAYDAIGQILAAHGNPPAGLQGRIKLANRLKTGLPAIKDPKTGHVVSEATPPMPPEVVRAAMDILYDKHLSKGTRAALRARYPGLYRRLVKAGYKGPGAKTPTSVFDRPGLSGH